MKTKIIDRSKCSGCKNCEIACIEAHSTGGYRQGLDSGIRARNKIELNNDGQRFPQFCRHCAEPACVEACMSGALQKQADGLVICDSEKCVGCYMCVMSCPYGNARPSLGSERSMLKCDGCADNDCMACAAVCPTGCISLSESDEATVYLEEDSTCTM